MWNRFLERWQELTREQQFSAVLLMICSVLAITLSFYRLQASVKQPFLVQNDSLLATKKIVGETQDQKDDRLKRLDTDGDGLSDWDEVNTYHTNPNARDTCGDNVPDNIRVATGKNMNCEENKTPNGAGVIDTSAVDAKNNNSLSPIDLTGIQNDMAKNSQATAQLIQGATGAATGTTVGQGAPPRDPAAIRAMLRGQVDDAKLNALTDEELLKLYDQAFAEAQTSASGTAATAPTSQ